MDIMLLGIPLRPRPCVFDSPTSYLVGWLGQAFLVAVSYQSWFGFFTCLRITQMTFFAIKLSSPWYLLPLAGNYARALKRGSCGIILRWFFSQMYLQACIVGKEKFCNDQTQVIRCRVGPAYCGTGSSDVVAGCTFYQPCASVTL